ncbi:MAG: hypothetical protein IJ571_10190 [Ruminococcus sp.]|nr:hypothetical protein [Ruminococcus sp.]
MNEKERYMLYKLSRRDLEADAEQVKLRISEPCQKRYNRRKSAKGGCSGQTSKLARYRSLCLRQKRLRLAILEKEAFYKKAAARGVQPTWFSAGREKNELTVMRAELAALSKKTEECLQMMEKLSGKVREAVLYRYLDMDLSSQPDWKKTAEHIGYEGSAEELRHEVVEELINKVLNK